MIRLLRIFAAFRALEAERDSQVVLLREALQQMTTEKLLLQDRLDAVLSDRAKLWDLMQESIRNERAAYQGAINVEWQKRGYGAPWPDAPQIPANVIPQQSDAQPHRSKLPGEVAAERTQQFIRTFVAGPRA